MPTLLIPPGDARAVYLGGLGVVYKITAQETGGLFSVVEHPIEPGRLVPPHMHTREDEFSYVLEGEIGVRIGGQEFIAPQGSYVFKPRNIPHTFWNASGRPARLIEFIAPGGMETYFEEVKRLIESGAQPGGPEHIALNERYGHTNEGMQWIPELMAKYGVRLIGGEPTHMEHQ